MQCLSPVVFLNLSTTVPSVKSYQLLNNRCLKAAFYACGKGTVASPSLGDRNGCDSR